MKVQLNSMQVELANSWLETGCKAYAYDSVKNIVWYRQPHYSGMVNNARKLSSEQLRQLNNLRSRQCGSGHSWVLCPGHPDQGTAYCG